MAKRIALAEPDSAVAEDWRQKGGAVHQEQDDSWWGGVVFIALLLGVGGGTSGPKYGWMSKGEEGRAAACATWKPRSNKAKLPKPNSGSRPSGSGPSCEDK